MLIACTKCERRQLLIHISIDDDPTYALLESGAGISWLNFRLVATEKHLLLRSFFGLLLDAPSISRPRNSDNF